jgi:hypothetical protein
MPAVSLHPAMQLLRECQDRALEREGIPMVLALVSEVGPMPEVSDDRARQEGRLLAGQMDELRSVIAPTGRDGDMGRVIAVLQVASYADFGRLEGP